MFEDFVLEVAKPHRRVFIALILVLFFVSLIGYALNLLYVNSQDLSFDLSLTRTIQSVDNPLFSDLMVFVSSFGSLPYVLVPFFLMAFWLLWRGSRSEALFLPIVFVAPVVSEISKLLIGRPRPDEGLVTVSGSFPGFSFPSGHVLFYTLFFGFSAFLALSLPNMKSGFRLVLFSVSVFLVLLVGISRIYLGAHWPTDVLAGYLAGFALLEILIVLYLKDVYLPKVREKQKQPNNN